MGTKERLPVIAIGMFLIAGFLTLMPIFKNWRLESHTRALVRKWAQKLDQQKIESGTYSHYRGPIRDEESVDDLAVTVIELPDEDAYHRKIVVTYLKSENVEELFVQSAGPDGTYGNEDDIVAGAKTGLRKALKKTAKDAVRETGRQLVGGMIQGAKEEIFKRKVEKKKGGKYYE